MDSLELKSREKNGFFTVALFSRFKNSNGIAFFATP